jgi:hypothetical protein
MHANLGDDDYVGLPDGGPSHDWSAMDYSLCNETVAEDFKTQYYRTKTERLAASGAASSIPFEHFDPALYRPENCIGYSQKLLVAVHILQLMDWIQFWDSLVAATNTEEARIPPAPDSLEGKVQGYLGAGKTFIIKMK